MAKSDDKGRGIIRNVMFMYVAVQNPKKKYQSEEREYSANVVFDKATSAEITALFPNKKMAPMDEDSFKAKYGMSAPFTGIFYVMKLSQPELRKDGSPIPDFARPRVLLETKAGIFDITDKKLVGNGSMGDVYYNYYTVPKFGKVLRLGNLVVKRLVEFEREGSGFIDNANIKELPDDFDFSEVLVSQDTSPVPAAAAGVASAPSDDALPF